MGEDDVVLVVGSGGRAYREYLLRGAASRRPVWLLATGEPTWQRDYAAGVSVVPLLDTARLIPDADGLRAAAAEVARHRPVAGVFTYDETIVMATARIAEDLGLPGLTVAGADRCRNKYLCRQALTAGGLPQPRFALAYTLDEARRAADEVGYPLVIKPRGMGASIGVVRVHGPGELDAAFAVSEKTSHEGAPAYEGGVILEEYLEGAEISVDGAVSGGEYQPFCVGHKRVGLEPYFEEIGHVVAAEDPLLADAELIKVLTEAHRLLGLGPGMTHTEVRFTSRGPAIIEVNARLGGDLIPYLGLLATGIDPGRVAVDVATGQWPAVPAGAPGRAPVVGIRFGYPPEDCVVGEVTLPEPGQVPGLLEAGAIAGPGERLLLPPGGYVGRHAYVICGATDEAACDTRLDEAIGQVGLSYEPLPG
jgi:biotin carboxylase